MTGLVVVTVGAGSSAAQPGRATPSAAEARAVAAARGPIAVDPGSLTRGEDPAVVHLVRDQIRDGARRVPATRLGRHEALWRVKGGYLLDDRVARRHTHRLVFVDPAGDKRVVARRHWPTGTAVSPSERRVSWSKALGRGANPPTVVKVAHPRSGRVIAARRFHYATVIGVSDHRALLTLLSPTGRRSTWWWDYQRDTLRRLSGQPGVRADLTHRRIVLGVGGEDSFCRRLAPLANPGRTLWRSCANSPRSWSPDGRLSLATYNYFDDAGVPRWVVKKDRTGSRIWAVTGRFGWWAVWEDDDHVLLLAQGDDGKAAVVRCEVGVACERASRLWALQPPDYLPNFIAPPVVLPSN